jgi:aryl-alcohol dehydrogenase-like predicted oxidoreductase
LQTHPQAPYRMKTFKLGRTDIDVTALCFGTDLIGSRIDRETSFQLFDQFYEGGGRYIDTGNFYSSWYPGCVGGESETTIGDWMKARGNRPQMVVQTKLGFDYPGSPGGLNAAEIERECEKSLRRLQTDVIDVYYAHRDDPETPLEETMEAFHRLIQAGKVRAIGASNLKLWRIAEANLLADLRGGSPYQVIEQRYTYFRPRHGADFGPQIFLSEETKAYSKARQMTLLGYSVLLQGAYTRADRGVPAQFAGPDADDRHAELRAVAQEVDATENQVIIAWMLQSDPVVLAIIAGSTPAHIAENLGALDVSLSDEQMRRLTTAGNPDIKKAWLR